MTHITLVRHGQASLGTANYDRLSPLGERQAALLGEHLDRSRQAFGTFVAGALERQQRTGSIALAQRSNGATTPLRTDEAFNEYDSKGVFSKYLPGVLENDPELKLAMSSDWAEVARNRRLGKRALLPVLNGWAMAGSAEQDVESFDAFSRRVREAVQSLISAGDDALVFTSSGVIGAILLDVLALPAERYGSLCYQIANASVNAVSVSTGDLEMTAFNSVMHLQRADEPELITYL